MATTHPTTTMAIAPFEILDVHVELTEIQYTLNLNITIMKHPIASGWLCPLN